MFGEFKKFILRGNVVDLAVGIVIGAAFTSVVNSLVRDMITPIVSAAQGKAQFAEASFTFHGAKFLYGDFINALVSFLIVALVVFFFVVQPINKLSALAFGSKTSEDDLTRKCPYCIGKVPKKATKCMFCTSALEPKE